VDPISPTGPWIPQEIWHAFLGAGAVRRYESGEVLVRQGDPGRYVVVLTAGHVKVTRVDADGNELFLAIRGPGDVIGEMAVLGDTTRSSTVTALASCITYILASESFLKIIREKHAEDILLRHVIARYRESEELRAELAGLPAMQRIARVLLRFADVVGGQHPKVDITQEELAGATGLSRASVTAKLAALRRQGLIVTRRNSLIIRDVASLCRVSRSLRSLALCLILDSERHSSPA
jgi:CRP/FNR family cyclic AMP-dependent transcriptional regulator